MKLNFFNTPDEVLSNLANYLVETAQRCISDRGRFTVALSGGSSPKKLYELLASDKYKSKVDWTKIYFFFGDERYVPHTSADSNFLMAKKALFDPLQISSTQIFAVNTTLEPKDAASDYAKTIDAFFGQETIFDLVLLGLGDNSHTASLFPYTPVLHDKEPTVKEVWLQDQQVFRITFTAPLINAASQIVFLVYGEGKAEAVHHVIEDERDIENYPAQLIKPTKGELEWFLDAAAASALSSKHH